MTLMTEKRQPLTPTVQRQVLKFPFVCSMNWIHTALLQTFVTKYTLLKGTWLLYSRQSYKRHFRMAQVALQQEIIANGD